MFRWPWFYHPTTPPLGEVVETIFRIRRKVLWPDTKSRICKAVGKVNGTDKTIDRIEHAVTLEESWDWD